MFLKNIFAKKFLVVLILLVAFNFPRFGLANTLSKTREGSIQAASIISNGIRSRNLGAQYDSSQSNIIFRVYSSRATRLEVCLYSNAAGTQENIRYIMAKDVTNVWSKTTSVATLKNNGITGTVYYGYRAWGPNWPYNSGWTKGSSAGFISDVDSAGNRFNPNKLLIDPYALEMSHDPNTPTNLDGTLYASGPAHRAKDSGSSAPKGIVLRNEPTSIGAKPTRALKDDIIYEVNVRGFTKNDSSVNSSYRGTYKGAALKASYLASLGITAVEFLPVQETQNDTIDVDPNSGTNDNYWGYMTLNYFAPDRRYSYDKSVGGPTREFKTMVKAFHDAGIKVYIDVVYNHTGEGGAWDSGTSTFNLLSWRGLDNPTYYTLTADLQNYWDNTGGGSNYNTFNPVAQDLIVDSLVYWRDSMGIDGFRFDLASVLGNTCETGCFNYDKSNSNTALNRIVREISPRPASGGQGTDLIAEPWAIGGNSYQVGNFPLGWSEWNGIYRDTFRKNQNELGVTNITPGQLASRFSGSSDLYQDDGRRPWNSVNFIIAHDGFTLIDLYSYNAKNNGQAWPYGPSDGGSDGNNSWDNDGDPSNQRKAARNGLTFMMLSAGTPMIEGGDEYLKSLQGNNNPYNLDSVPNWLNYTWNTNQTNFNTFTKRLISFRKTHPALRPLNFYSSSDTNGNVMEQLRWFKPDGNVPESVYFNNPNNHAIAYRIDGTEFSDPSSAIYVAYNGGADGITFTLPWPGIGKNWYRVTDTATWNEGSNTVVTPGSEVLIGGEYTNYMVHGRSIILLIAK